MTVPDIYVLQIDPEASDESLRLMAELRSAPSTRNCPIIAVLPEQLKRLAATVLDLGASDVTCGTVNPRELALRIAAQLDHKQNADQMRAQLHVGLQAAVIDPLTGLYNRRYALPFVENLIRKQRTHDHSFAVMVADLDHFKQVNDKYGHAAGDAVLTRIADILRNNARDEDLIARLGGEEFLIVTPETSSIQAKHAASRLCQIIQRTPIEVPGQSAPIHVTISIGVAMCQKSQSDARLSVDALLDHADRALYGSKADGRNTVTLAARSAA